MKTAIISLFLATSLLAQGYKSGQVLGVAKKELHGKSHAVLYVEIWHPLEGKAVTVRDVPQRFAPKIKVGQVFPLRVMKVPEKPWYVLAPSRGL